MPLASHVSTGLITLLEDECNLPKPSEENLVTRLNAVHEKHACLHPPVRPAPKGLSPRFAVAHFAGVVEYESTGFVKMNSDALHAELPMLLGGSTDTLVAALFGDEATTAPTPLQVRPPIQSSPRRPPRLHLDLDPSPCPPPR